jgi:hypothetical protein
MNPRALGNFFKSKFGLFVVFVVVLFAGLWIYGQKQAGEREAAKLAAQKNKKVELGQMKVPLNQGLESGTPQQVKPEGAKPAEANQSRAASCRSVPRRRSSCSKHRRMRRQGTEGRHQRKRNRSRARFATLRCSRATKRPRPERSASSRPHLSGSSRSARF